MKIQKMLLGLACTILLAGCQSAPDQNLIIDEQPLDRRVGVIKSFGGIKASNNGTHFLELDSGDTILLKSIQINLDESKYANKIVEVRGVLDYTKDQKQIMTVMNIDVLDEDILTDKEPSWKNYSRDDLNISLKYWDEFKVSETSNETSFKVKFESADNPDVMLGHEFSVKRITISEDDNLISYLGLKDDSDEELLASSMSKSKIGKDSLDALKKSFNGGTMTKYYTQSGAMVYVITLDEGNDEKSSQHRELFLEMLDSFEILEEGVSPIDSMELVVEDEAVETVEDEETEEKELDLEGFALYESESFKFKVQYPKNWYFEGKSTGEPGVIRHYDFGSSPLDEAPGTVGFDIISGSMPSSGSSVTINGVKLTKITKGDSIELYVKGSGSRVYRVRGPADDLNILLIMASTAEDL